MALVRGVMAFSKSSMGGRAKPVLMSLEGRVKEHLGGIADYLDHLKKESELLLKQEEKKEVKVESVKDSQQMRQESKEARRKKKEIEKLENEIAELDNKIAEIEINLSSNIPTEKIEELSKLYADTKALRDAKLDEWSLKAL